MEKWKQKAKEQRRRGEEKRGRVGWWSEEMRNEHQEGEEDGKWRGEEKRRGNERGMEKVEDLIHDGKSVVTWVKGKKEEMVGVVCHIFQRRKVELKQASFFGKFKSEQH